MHDGQLSWFANKSFIENFEKNLCIYICKLTTHGTIIEPTMSRTRNFMNLCHVSKKNHMGITWSHLVDMDMGIRIGNVWSANEFIFWFGLS